MNAPDVIWLQWHGDGEPYDRGDVDPTDVTWCQDKIYEHDVKYIRVTEPESAL